MTILAMQGIRGGCGTTAVCASLAWALAQTGQSVLVVDFSINNVLRLHFNHAWSSKEGWASALKLQQSPPPVISYAPGIDYLPFGFSEKETYSLINEGLFEQKEHQPEKLPGFLAFLSSNDYQWIIIDCSNTLSSLKELSNSLADINLVLLNPDVECHVLLGQNSFPANRYFLINGFSPTSLIQQDISHIWQQSLSGLIPVILHRDEAMAESLAVKKTPGESQPDSLIVQDIHQLALWCQSLDKQGS
ncbi:cellulose synthase operon protein YhjQ [Budviciaceae bacterium BWR-B9]|uniref:Cellulose synthase operon protein YhjQ n=1 Tax=Limnobaculum allomyrinae TaxID=2791986 RepID=A0ABS1IQJ2_9GAMM|nr:MULTISPECIES: cellulose biosynthesis protein BcsQ [Limnobaculum]MBK5143972.1 cellulose synthase operon protein YhjQ [Limnobaculum allomyrinae]MBV7691631.1 cellulose synthase operon protein YhjQ [Limnobaculum sp. M2-1]